MDANTPLNVELRAFIESHFKCTIMNVKLIFRLGFGVKSQDIRGRRLHADASDALDLAIKKKPQYLSFRGCIELHDWKGIYKAQFHLRAHCLGRFWCENMKFSSRPPRSRWL